MIFQHCQEEFEHHSCEHLTLLARAEAVPNGTDAPGDCRVQNQTDNAAGDTPQSMGEGDS